MPNKPDIPTASTTPTIPARIHRLRDRMRAEGIDACIVPTGDPHMSEYTNDHYKAREFITGFTGSAGTAVITTEDAGLWTDSRYFLQAADQLAGSGVTLYKERLPGTPQIHEYLLQRLAFGSIICVDGRLVSASWAEALQENTAASSFRLRTDLDLVGEIWEDRPPAEFHPVFEYPLEFAGVPRTEKIAAIRDDLAQAGADALILTQLSDIAWLTNLRGSDVTCNPVFFAFAIITATKALLYAHTDAFTPQLAQTLADDGIELLPYHRFYDDLAGVHDDRADGHEERSLVEGDSVPSIMLDPGTCSERILQSLPEDVVLIHAPSPAAQRKAIKNQTEMKGIHSAHLKDGIAMCKFLYWLKAQAAQAAEAQDSQAAGAPSPQVVDAQGPHVAGAQDSQAAGAPSPRSGMGVTEMSAAEVLHEFRAQQELFMGDSFETIVGYGPHAAIVHYCATPESDVELEAQGLVLIDSGGQYLDGTTDITRTIVLGPLQEKEKVLFTTVLRGHIALAKAVFPKGVTGANLDYLAHAPLWQVGLDYRHGTGHGVGHFLNVHEGPNRFGWNTENSSEAIPAFAEGMLTSDEPGYYEDHAFGIRHESLLLCREAAATEYGEFLQFVEVTLVPFDLDGILPEMMQPDEIAYLNQYHKTVFDKIAPYLDEDERAWLRDATRAI